MIVPIKHGLFEIICQRHGLAVQVPRAFDSQGRFPRWQANLSFSQDRYEREAIPAWRPPVESKRYAEEVLQDESLRGGYLTTQ
jgi:hypothetical protein